MFTLKAPVLKFWPKSLFWGQIFDKIFLGENLEMKVILSEAKNSEIRQMCSENTDLTTSRTFRGDFQGF